MPTELTMPTRVDLEGRPWWRFADGTLLPVVSGGDGDGDGGDGGGSEGDGSGDGSGEDQLGDAGKKALADERAARKAAEKAQKAADKRAKDLEDRLTKLEGDQKSDTDKALEQARQEARDAATKEATAKANARIVRAEVKAAAGNKLADPNDAVRLLDLDEFEVDDDGEVDTKAIAKAIDDLVKDKPYLAGQKPPPGSGDGGARRDGKDADVKPGGDRLRHAYATTSKTKK